MKLPAIAHNRLCYAGAAIAALALTAATFLVIFDTFVGRGEAPYSGIIVFVVLPAVMFFGVALSAVGMVSEWRHVRRTGAPSIKRLPVIDLNDTRQRTRLFLLTIAAGVLLFFSVFGSFQAYEETESVAFCGATCHPVMQPEYVAYQFSPHARVRCVACHVGPGADWYIKSKLTGVRQLYMQALDDFPRPLPAAVTKLRPARFTCENCHWSKRFIGILEKRYTHFLPDATNTRWDIHLLLRVGGEPDVGHGKGIHWHMNLGSRIEYFATDPARQQIPWMQVTDLSTGATTVYAADDGSAPANPPPANSLHTMDCIDCHNRPAHILYSPAQSLDEALGLGAIDPSLPSIRLTGAQLLTAEYASVDAAMAGIDAGLRDFYRKNNPQVAASQASAIENAVTALQQIYRQNFFPAMKARWDVYPTNIGHLSAPGCFRCHDGKHKSPGGKVLSNGCTDCHSIAAQGTPPALTSSGAAEGLPFQHPIDIGDAWQMMPCHTCHTGM